MKTENAQVKKRVLKSFWTKKDRKLFRLNLAEYQNHPGEPAQPAAHLHHRKAS